MCSVESLPGDTELLVAGFPCVDVSRAGLRRGIRGKSTGLVKHVFRLLKVAKDDNRPINWVLLENVEALLDRIGDQPPPIAYILQQLEELGYGSWAYRVIDSTGFGIPMRRKRVFIVASMHGDARDVLLTQGMQPCLGACRGMFDDNPCYSCHTLELRNRTSNRDVNFGIDLAQATAKPGEDVLPSLTTSNDRILLLLRDGRVGMLRVEDGERMQGLPEGWTRNVYPLTGEGVHGHRRQHGREGDLETHNSKRWQLLGNAVTVDVARWLGERLMHPYAYKYRNSEGVFRIDELVYEDETAKASRKRVAKAKEPMNVWSFVTVDEVQEAAIFSFRRSGERKYARMQVPQDAAAGAAGMDLDPEKSEVRIDDHSDDNVEVDVDDGHRVDDDEEVDVENHIGDDIDGRPDASMAAAPATHVAGSMGQVSPNNVIAAPTFQKEGLLVTNASSCAGIDNACHATSEEESGEASEPLHVGPPIFNSNGHSPLPVDHVNPSDAASGVVRDHVAPGPKKRHRGTRPKVARQASVVPRITTPNKTQENAKTNAPPDDNNNPERSLPIDGCNGKNEPGIRSGDDDDDDNGNDNDNDNDNGNGNGNGNDDDNDFGALSDADKQRFKGRFQARTYNKIKKGILQSSSGKDVRRALALSADKTWPKCGWWQKGVGSFGVTRWSPHPVVTPFIPLSDFIIQVGRSPTQEECAGYVHRLKEKGWDINEEVIRRITGTHNLAFKSADVTRIPGLLEDHLMVGELVWAPWKDSSADTGEIHWPGEVLDPTNMPIGRTLPKHALDRLSSEERRASTISATGAWDHRDYADSEQRCVLVVFFPVNTGKWQWYHPKALLPWEENRVQYEKLAHEAIKRPNFGHAEMLERAMQDAMASHGVKNQINRLSTDKMIQTRAAAASAMVDLKQRCGRCRTCMNAYAGTKRFDCLTQRMTASALGGHAGAQLSMCGDKAIGARVAVWWDGDQEFFEGTICWYDPVSTEHTVAYDDGEIGMHRLWQHDEHILIMSEVEDWPREAVAVRQRLQDAMQEPVTDIMTSKDLENKKRATELANRMPELTEYELNRQRNIDYVSQFRLSIGLSKAADG